MGKNPIDHTFLKNHDDAGNNGDHALGKYFPDGKYQDIAGLCKVASLEDIEAQGYSLNPGRYVGVTQGEQEHDEDFFARLTALQEELTILNGEAHELENVIAENVSKILEAAI